MQTNTNNRRRRHQNQWFTGMYLVEGYCQLIRQEVHTLKFSSLFLMFILKLFMDLSFYDYFC